MNKALLSRFSGKPDFSGYSLVEVLLSSTILTILILLLLGMTDGASRLWRDGERRREPTLEAREGLRMIATDLRSAVLTDDPESLVSGMSVDDGTSTDGLFLLVTHPSEERLTEAKGDLCVAGYFTAPTPEGLGERHLYRFHASGEEVAEAVRHHTLKELYRTARPGSTNTELLARHIEKMSTEPALEEKGRHPDALRVSLLALNGETARRVASHPREKEIHDSLIKQHGVCLSEIVRLPPRREIHPPSPTP
jgi:hypothetical protein